MLTAFYTTRMVLKTFFGEYRGHEHRARVAVASMTAPLVVLAGVTCFVGLLGFAPLGAPFLDWVYFGARARDAGVQSARGAAVGDRGRRSASWSATWSTATGASPTRSCGLGRFTTILEHKYYLDDFYWDRIVQPIRDPIAAGVYWFNQHVFDGVVNGAAWVTLAASRGRSRGSTAP